MVASVAALAATVVAVIPKFAVSYIQLGDMARKTLVSVAAVGKGFSAFPDRGVGVIKSAASAAPFSAGKSSDALEAVPPLKISALAATVGSLDSATVAVVSLLKNFLLSGAAEKKLFFYEI